MTELPITVDLTVQKEKTAFKVEADEIQTYQLKLIEEPQTVELTTDTSKRAFALCLETHDEVHTMTNSMTIEAGSGGEPYSGEYTVIPKAKSETVLNTRGKYMRGNVTVTKIQTFETHNNYGTTLYIAEVE